MSKRRAKDQPGGQVQRMGELRALLARARAAMSGDLRAILAAALPPAAPLDHLSGEGSRESGE